MAQLLCLETLRIWQRRLPDLLPEHQTRFDRTRQALWPTAASIQLADYLRLPDWLLAEQVYKCRITYGPTIEKVEFERYQVRPVHTLRLIDASTLNYSYKWANRQALDALFAQRGIADDVVLVRNGLITDSSYANLAFSDGQKWLTPAQPLLEGTHRARLIRQGILHPTLIRIADLHQFRELKLVNALLDWHTTPTLPISAVIQE